MTINRIDIVSIPVNDQQKAKAFYKSVLGFEVVRDNPMGPERRWVQMAPKGAETSITLVTWFENMPAGSLDGMVLNTDDIAVTHTDLKTRGLEISSIDEAPWGKYATFCDPDGNGWVLVQAVPEEQSEPG